EKNADARGKATLVRAALDQLPEHAFAAMPELRGLDLSFCPLRALPESFFALRALTRVNLQYTKLSARALARIAQVFPEGVRIDLRNVPRKEQSSKDPNWKKVHELTQKAANEPVIDKKIAGFEKALAACKPGKAYSSYDELYATYGLLLALAQRVTTTRAKAARQPLVSRVTELATRALELVPRSIWHFTDRGAFEEEVTRQAANALAWYGMEAAKSPDALERALAALQRGLAVARR